MTKKMFLAAFCLLSLSVSAQEAVTATSFKLLGEDAVNNVKVKWEMNPQADEYHVFRDGSQIAVVKGDTWDDYGLEIGKTYTYHVEAFKDAQRIAVAKSQAATTYKPTSTDVAIYDNLDGKYVKQASHKKPSGFKIGNLYYSYKMESIEKDNVRGWQMTESFSKDGLTGWSKPREIAFYPGVKFEGNSFHYNPKTGKVVFSSHYEDAKGYTAAKIFLAQITPKGTIVVGTKERPLGHDSRDQSLFIDDDNTAYLLSATNVNSDINIYKLDPTWTKVVSLVNTICERQHRETPAIIKRNGEYYFFSSKASGWYPSQTKYCSAKQLDGKWSELREIGNNTTFGAQFNRISKIADVYGVWSYHWGAQYHHKDEAGNFPRISIAAFNEGYASMDYYRYIEMDDKYGLIPVQAGRYLSLGKPVEAIIKNGNGYSADCLTDGCSLASAKSYKKGSVTSIGTPYMLTIDLQKPSALSEITMSTNLVNGSEAAYRYVIEASEDGNSYEQIVDGTNNWMVGYQILKPSDTQTKFRYLRLRVYGITVVKNGNSGTWADGIMEIAAFGK